MSNDLIHNLPFSDYLGIKALSKTFLAQFAITPAHSQVPIEDTAAMLVGRAFHTAVLEPDLFLKQYTTYPEGSDGRSKAGKAFKAEHPDHEFLNKAQWAEVQGMTKAVRARKTSGNLIKHSEHEVSAVWQHPGYDFECKNRYDMLRPDKRIITDLKKAQPAEFDDLQRTIWKRKYHWQAAFYIQGAEICTEMVGGWSFIFIFVCSAPPYTVQEVLCDPEMIYQAQEEIKRILPEYEQCRRSGVWPGTKDELITIGLSDWAKKQFNAE